MIINKLPKLLQSQPLMVKVAQLIQGKKVLFSSIVYLQNGKKHIITKNHQTPYFSKDWQCYSFLRSNSNTLITTGSIIRAERDLFKSHFACGDKLIQQMYFNFRLNQKQSVYVMTNSMPKQQIMPYFNTQIYNVIVNQFSKQGKAQKVHLNQILQGLLQEKRDPILVQCGPVIMNKYFDLVKKGSIKNQIQGAYLGFFQGHLQEHSIGSELQFDQTLFDTVWESEKFDIQHKGQLVGKVYFRVYKGKHSN